MRYTFKALAVVGACAMLLVGASSADAKGCLKGAVVGGVAGHMAGHGMLGAAGGCAVGHHMAATKAARNNEAQTQSQSAPDTSAK